MEWKSQISKHLRKPLPIERVEFRIQSVSTNGWVTMLAYKDARVDMERLDEVAGALNWKREHSRENKNCTVSIWDNEKKQWISKEDTGTESYTEKEKGLASDSFKRACFNWGIGIELYDYPHIWFQLYPNEFRVENNKAKTTYELKLKKWKWEMESKDGQIIVKATDDKGRVRFDSTKDFNSIPKQESKQPAPAQPKPEQKNTAKPKMKKELYEKALKSEKADILTQALTKYDLTSTQLNGISKRIKELNDKS